jgi:hypothetical protein
MQNIDGSSVKSGNGVSGGRKCSPGKMPGEHFPDMAGNVLMPDPDVVIFVLSYFAKVSLRSIRARVLATGLSECLVAFSSGGCLVPAEQLPAGVDGPAHHICDIIPCQHGTQDR